MHSSLALLYLTNATESQNTMSICLERKEYKKGKDTRKERTSADREDSIWQYNSHA